MGTARVTYPMKGEHIINKIINRSTHRVNNDKQITDYRRGYAQENTFTKVSINYFKQDYETVAS